MIEASFDAKRSSEAAIRGAYQYDTGQRLKMHGLPSPEELAREDDFLSGSEVAVQVQYGFIGDAQTEMRLALYDREEGAWRADIPDLYLSKSVPVHVYVYVSYGSTEKEGRAKTCYEAVFTPESRPAPSSRVTPAQVNAWNTLVIEVNMTLAAMNTSISEANAAAAEANTARDQAQEAAGTANQSASRADAARDAANGAAASANGAAGSANAAAAGANVAASTAEKAAGTADTAAQQARTAAAGADKAAKRIETLSVKASTNQPGTNATASLREENGRRVLLLGIPQGLKGETGERGKNGAPGPKGEQGPEGPAGVAAVEDTRAENDSPGWYMKNKRQRLICELKTPGVIQCDLDGTFAVLITTVPWGDYGGGYPIQMAVSTSSGDIRKRVGISDDRWGPWRKLGDTNYALSGTTLMITTY